MQKKLSTYRKAVALMLIVLIFCYVFFYGKDELEE